MASKRGIILELLLLAVLPGACLISVGDAAAESSPDIVLRTTVRGEQNQSYIELPFDVPPGVARLTVTFKYTGKR